MCITPTGKCARMDRPGGYLARGLASLSDNGETSSLQPGELTICVATDESRGAGQSRPPVVRQFVDI